MMSMLVAPCFAVSCAQVGGALLVQATTATWCVPGDVGKIAKADLIAAASGVEDVGDPGFVRVAVDRRIAGAVVHQVQAEAALVEAGDRACAHEDLALTGRWAGATGALYPLKSPFSTWVPKLSPASGPLLKWLPLGGEHERDLGALSRRPGRRLRLRVSLVGDRVFPAG